MNALLAELRRHRWSDDTDAVLLARFRNDRDEAAFAELVGRHGAVVWGACRRGLNATDAEDAFQATFLVLLRRHDTLPADVPLGPWLYRVAVLTVRNLQRANRRRRAASPSPSTTTSDAIASMTLGWDVEEAVARLPQRLREAVVLCKLQGLTRADAAARLGVPEGTLSARLTEATRRLRHRLGDNEIPIQAVVVPVALVAATARTAAAYSLSSMAAGVSPGIVSLSEGVLPMFAWKKMTAAALVAVGLLTTTVVGFVSAEKPVAEPPKAEEAKTKTVAPYTGKWKLTKWTTASYSDVCAVFELAEKDGKPVVVQTADKPHWGYPIDELTWADGMLKFRINFYQTRPGSKEDSFSRFEGRVDPANASAIRGSCWNERDVTKAVYAVDLEPATYDAPTRGEGMTSLLTPGLGSMMTKMLDHRSAKRSGKPWTDEQQYAAERDGDILRLVAENRRANRRGAFTVSLLIDYAQFCRAKPEEVERWIAECLRFHEPYGPRLCRYIREKFADALADQGDDYKPLVAKMRGEKPDWPKAPADLPPATLPPSRLPLVGGDPKAKPEQAVTVAPASLTGVVTDPDGKPIPGARVTGDNFGSVYGNDEAVTDGEGRYKLPFMPRVGKAVIVTQLRVVAFGFVPYDERFTTDDLTTSAAKPGRFDVVLAPGGPIAGTVLGVSKSIPVVVRGPSFVKTIQTNDDGRFRVDVPKGSYTLTALIATERRPRLNSIPAEDLKGFKPQWAEGTVILKSATATGVKAGTENLVLEAK